MNKKERILNDLLYCINIKSSDKHHEMYSTLNPAMYPIVDYRYCSICKIYNKGVFRANLYFLLRDVVSEF